MSSTQKQTRMAKFSSEKYVVATCTRYTHKYIPAHTHRILYTVTYTTKMLNYIN